jgi:serine/threonine protein kinase
MICVSFRTNEPLAPSDAMEPQSVQFLCNTLVRTKLLSPDEVRALFQRWQGEARQSTGDVEKFVKWLVARQALSDFQAGLLLKGNTDRLFLGEYKLIERIGKGRMAGVYLAKHGLGQSVAVKILPPSKARDPQVLARFQRESRLALKLKHPNIVRAFQAGESNGLHYIVMEYLEGETLEDALERRKKLPATEAVRLVHQALLGLQHLHEKDMVHRDLKPANLMLVPGQVPGRPDNTLTATVKILDIGLGRALFDEGAPSGQAADLTSTGEILGSPDYMAPEQARDAHRADIRADIYSLGCVLYHALTGQVPFPDSNTVRKMVKHATEAPRPVRTLAPDVPEGLQQVLDWMMAKDPGQRYPTPERAAEALQVFLVAGSAPARSVEGDPSMSSYLEWLRTQPTIEEPVALPQPPPRPAPAARPASAPPVAKPAPAPAPAAKADLDVELVPVAPPAPSAPPPKPAKQLPKGRRKPWELTRRDLILLGIGAAGVAVAGIVGIILARSMAPRPTPPDNGTPSP